MSSQVAKVIGFVNYLPVTTNPFSATAAFLEDMIKGTINSRWSHLTEWACLVGFVIMFLQSLPLFIRRIRMENFRTARFDKMGLLIIDAPDVTAVTILIYTLLTVVFFALQLAVEKKLSDERSALIIFGCKFLAILTNAWAYLWVCACKCAELFWESDYVSQMATSKQERLKASLKWGMHLFFLTVVLVPFPMVFWTTAQIVHPFTKILSKLHEVTVALRLAAGAYNPQTYTKPQLLQYLIPAQRMLSPLREVENRIAFTIKLYTCVLTLLIVIYAPLLFFSLKGLHKRSLMHAAQDATAGQKDNSQPSALTCQFRRQKKQLLYHAVSTYSSILVHYPVVLWLAVHTSEGFTMEPKWRVMCYYGLSIPFCITGNVMLAILNYLPTHMGSTGTTFQDIEKGSGGMGERKDPSGSYMSPLIPIPNFSKRPSSLTEDEQEEKLQDLTQYLRTSHRFKFDPKYVFGVKDNRAHVANGENVMLHLNQSPEHNSSTQNPQEMS